MDKGITNTSIIECPVSCTVKRGNRKKTVAIKVHPNGEVAVHAPPRLSPIEINKLLQKRSEWISEKQRVFKDLQERFPPHDFEGGETFYYLGRRSRLKISQGHQDRAPLCRLKEGRLWIQIGSLNGNQKEKVKGLIKNWYVQKTAIQVGWRVEKFRKCLTATPTSIKVSTAGKRWGSCTKNGALRFHWTLSMAPPFVMDYIVVHELCHMQIPNHSEKFWRLVQSILPDFRKRQEWLKTHSPYFLNFV